MICVLGPACSATPVSRAVVVSVALDLSPLQHRSSLSDTNTWLSLLLVLQSFKASGQSPFEIDVSLLARERPGLILTQVCHTRTSTSWGHLAWFLLAHCLILQHAW